MGVDLKTTLNIPTTQLLTREDKFYLRWRMYNDDYYYQVRNRLRLIYAKADKIKIDKQIDSTNNVFKQVIDKISRVYAFGVSRTIENEALRDALDAIEFADFMEEATRYYNGFNDVIVQVGWDFDNQIPRLKFRLPHKTKVEVNEYDEPVSVEYLVDDNMWAHWSNDEHYYKIYKAGEEVEIVGADDNDKYNMTNPYGFMPFVFIQKGYRDGVFFDEFSGDDLVNITLDNAVYSTFKNYLIKWQSFKQLVISGSQIGGIEGQLLDPSTALTVSAEDAKVDLLDLQANLKELSDTLKASVDAVATNYKISPASFNLSSSVTSGFSKAMENADLDAFTRKQQKHFARYEKMVIDMIVKVAEANGVNYQGEVAIKINEPHYPESRQATADANAKEIEMGIISPVEVIMDRYGITEEEAIVKYQSNINMRNKANDKFTPQPTVTLPINTGA